VEYPGLVPETALALLQALLRSMAYVLLGAALIALCVYIVLVGSEMLSRSGSKPKRAKVLHPARRVHVAEGTLDPSAATPILLVPDTVENAEALVNISVRRAQIPTTAQEAELGGSVRLP
jgi:hypothetical protein